MNNIEDILMAHRYLYYILGEPAISDFVYDQMEREARAILPEASPIQGIGSSLTSSYSIAQIKLAETYL